jgi:hypothetical protein
MLTSTSSLFCTCALLFFTQVQALLGWVRRTSMCICCNQYAYINFFPLLHLRIAFFHAGTGAAGLGEAHIQVHLLQPVCLHQLLPSYAPVHFCCYVGTGAAGLGEAHIQVRLDMEAIAALQLAIDAHTVKWSILDTPKMKLKPDAIRAVSIDTLLVVPPDASRQGLLFGLEQLMAALPKVRGICGHLVLYRWVLACFCGTIRVAAVAHCVRCLCQLVVLEQRSDDSESGTLHAATAASGPSSPLASISTTRATAQPRLHKSSTGQHSLTALRSTVGATNTSHTMRHT